MDSKIDEILKDYPRLPHEQVELKAQLKQLLVEARIDEAQLQYDLARAAHSKGHILTHQEERLAALQGDSKDE